MTAEVAPAVGGAVRRVNVQHGGFLGGCLSGTEAVLAFWVRLEHLIAHADKDVGFRAGGQLLIITLEKIAVASAINPAIWASRAAHFSRRSAGRPLSYMDEAPVLTPKATTFCQSWTARPADDQERQWKTRKNDLRCDTNR